MGFQDMHVSLFNSSYHIASFPPSFYQMTNNEDQHYYKTSAFCQQSGYKCWTIHVPKVTVDHHEVFKKGTIFHTLCKLPSQKRPQQCRRGLPHAVQDKVHKASPCQCEYTAVFTLKLMEPNDGEYYNKEQCMCKYPSVTEHVLKHPPSDDLINDVRKDRPNTHIQVIDTWSYSWDKEGQDVEYGKGDPYVCEEEHRMIYILLLLYIGKVRL